MIASFFQPFVRMFKNRSIVGLFFVLPAFLVVILLLIYPIIITIFYSFTSKSLIFPNYENIGLENYISILTDIEFLKSFWVSIKWTFFSIVFQVIIGFTAALALNRIPKLQGMYRTFLIIPWAFPVIVIALSWQWILDDVNGFIPNLLTNLGITSGNVALFSDPSFAFWTIVFINVWFEFPLIMVNVLAALQTIPKEQIEAARIDGASIFQTFWYITLRRVRVVVGILIVLRTIWVFNNFEMVYLLTGGGPAGSTTTLPIFAYKTGWDLQQLGMASAVTLLLVIFLLIISLLYFKLLNKWQKRDEV